MLNQVSNSLLLPSGLQLSDLTKVLDHFSSRQIDYADLYFQFSQDESWSLEDSIIKEGGFYIDRG
ncbi:metalloprotease TldD, partial [Glaesserella parasuis]|nr:metalloprotease TldD [Glaesserella parasuis]MDG6790049.1 metalloprotease TldD [Glaesserella parasuis]MDG6807878.1 metalloprotease TldD [Glaesserella parasuis]